VWSGANGLGGSKKKRASKPHRKEKRSCKNDRVTLTGGGGKRGLSLEKTIEPQKSQKPKNGKGASKFQDRQKEKKSELVRDGDNVMVPAIGSGLRGNGGYKKKDVGGKKKGEGKKKGKRWKKEKQEGWWVPF